MKKSIIKYEIPDEGKLLYSFIKKRLLLNKNNQLYQLASLLTLDGIINYRKITISRDFEENVTDYFHSIFELKDTYPDYNKKIPVNHYRNNEHEKCMTILNGFSDQYPQEIYSNKKTKTKIVSDKKQKNQSSLRQLSLNRFIFQKNRKSNDKDNSNKKDILSENNALIVNDDSN